MSDNNSVANAARRIIELQAEIAERQEAVENYKQFIADTVTEPEQVVQDDRGNLFKVNRYTYRRFDANWGKFQRPDLWEKYATSKPVLTAADAKKRMTEEEYAAFQKVSDKPSVTIETLAD